MTRMNQSAPILCTIALVPILNACATQGHVLDDRVETYPIQEELVAATGSPLAAKCLIAGAEASQQTHSIIDGDCFDQNDNLIGTVNCKPEWNNHGTIDTSCKFIPIKSQP